MIREADDEWRMEWEDAEGPLEESAISLDALLEKVLLVRGWTGLAPTAA